MRLVVLAMLAASAVAGCAPALPSIGGDPASPAAPASQSQYRSPFKDYVKFGLVEPRPWRETNDRVRALGGPNVQMQADSEDDPMPAKDAAGDQHKH